MTLQVPFRGISWENIHFCGFLKKTYIANGRKIKVNSTKKYVKFLSSGYFFSLYISPLSECLGESCFPVCWKVSRLFQDFLFQDCLRMLGKGLQLKTTVLLVFFLWLVKSLKNVNDKIVDK